MNKKGYRKGKALLWMPVVLLFLCSGCGTEKERTAAADQGTQINAADQGTQINAVVETVRTDTFSMEYCKFGNGEKTFVILPGLSVQSVMGLADSIAEAYGVFADEYTVYLFDRRKDLPASYSVQEMARDTAEAMRALNLDHVNLFGASQGGMIAMEIAIQYPELVQKLVLGSTAARVEDTAFGSIEKWIQQAEAGDGEQLYLAFGEAVYPKEMFEQSRDLLIEAGKTVTDEDFRRFIILAEGMRGFDAMEDLQKISCPVLVIGSMDDQVLGADASIQIAKHLGSRQGPVLIMYDGYGHAVYDTAPDYKERIRSFFADEQNE